jgi:DNA-binding CsgD family transcriptional regulator
VEIFISWSGLKSHAVAEALRKWLPKVVNAFNPWISSEDIDKGARWSAELSAKLAAVKAGIICLTPSNLASPWVLFEAGAISKTLSNTFVCTLLVGLEPSDVSGPLAQFQATRTTKNDILRLVKNLSQALGEAALPETHIDEMFEVLWPKLEADLGKLPDEGTEHRRQRKDREILEEILDLLRNQSRASLKGPTVAVPLNFNTGALSPRELQVAEQAVQGMSNRQIAELLGISEHTVKNYLFHVFEKMKVSNRFELLFRLFRGAEASEPEDKTNVPPLPGEDEKNSL